MSPKHYFGFHFFRTHLSVRLMAIFIVIALVPLMVVSLVSYQRAYTSLINMALSKIEQDVQSITKETNLYMEQFASDLLILGGTPPVQGIIRARDNKGIDPIQNVPYDIWVNRLTQIFAIMARNKEFYQQLRYINENGDEMVRVDYRNQEVIILSGTDKLQNKAHSPYFIAAKTLRNNEIYISPVNLNREKGQIEVPHTPVILLSTPIYDNNNRFRGVVISNIYVANMISRLTVNLGKTYLTNKAGFYLSHPDSSRTFGFELGTNDNIRFDFPLSLNTLMQSGLDSYVTVDKDRKEVVLLQKIYFNPINHGQYWILIRAIPENEALGAVKGLRGLMLGLAVLITLIVIFLAHWLAKRFTQPIIRLQNVTQQITQTHLPQVVNAIEQMAKGDLSAKLTLHTQCLEVQSLDEIGQLTAAFNEMSSKLCESTEAFEEMISNLRVVIKDLVFVSQGLAEGNLRISPQAEYQGDFIQIKKAMEMALFNIRQVVENIVQVSKGLAEGERHLITQAEYRGDFVQIKNALETAATKLHEAMAQNAKQDWLKTGQTHLNEHIRGDQEMRTLAKNIITFLTAYLEAQVGVFYLLEDGEGNKGFAPKKGQGEMSHRMRLKLVASYAYTQRKGMSNEFEIGEGLIGQVALEKQRIIVNEVPEDYIHIQSGLGEAIPQNLIVIPFLYENTVKGVIEMGSFHAITEVQLEFLDQVMPNIGIAVNTAESRTKMQALISEQ